MSNKNDIDNAYGLVKSIGNTGVFIKRTYDRVHNTDISGNDEPQTNNRPQQGNNNEVDICGVDENVDISVGIIDSRGVLLCLCLFSSSVCVGCRLVSVVSVGFV